MELRKYDKEWLEELCKDSFSLAEVLKKAGRKPGGGSQATLKAKIIEFGIDTSHFTGQSWNKGKTKEDDIRVSTREKYSLEEVFCENSLVTQKMLRGYIERHKVIPYECELCGCDGNWLDGTIALELHHKDGCPTNNLKENLSYLCPNCHALTANFRGKNKQTNSKAEVAEEDFVKALKEKPNIRQALISLNLAPKGANYERANRLMIKYHIQK